MPTVDIIKVLVLSRYKRMAKAKIVAIIVVNRLGTIRV